MRILSRLWPVLLAALILSGCGQKGDLVPPPDSRDVPQAGNSQQPY